MDSKTVVMSPWRKGNVVGIHEESRLGEEKRETSRIMGVLVSSSETEYGSSQRLFVGGVFGV